MNELADIFIAPDPIIAGLKLRPFTAGSYRIAQRRGLSLFTGSGADLAPDEQLDQAMAFLYMQSAPLQTVLASATDAAKWKNAVDEFSFTIPIGSIQEASKLIAEVCEQAGMAVVEVQQKPGSTGTDTPPPNS